MLNHGIFTATICVNVFVVYNICNKVKVFCLSLKQAPLHSHRINRMIGVGCRQFSPTLSTFIFNMKSYSKTPEIYRYTFEPDRGREREIANEKKVVE